MKSLPMNVSAYLIMAHASLSLSNISFTYPSYFTFLERFKYSTKLAWHFR